MTLVKQDWSKLEDTVPQGNDPLAFRRLEALWYMTHQDDEPNHYPVPALRIKVFLWDGYTIENKHDDAWYIVT